VKACEIATADVKAEQAVPIDGAVYGNVKIPQRIVLRNLQPPPKCATVVVEANPHSEYVLKGIPRVRRICQSCILRLNFRGLQVPKHRHFRYIIAQACRSGTMSILAILGTDTEFVFREFGVGPQNSEDWNNELLRS